MHSKKDYFILLVFWFFISLNLFGADFTKIIDNRIKIQQGLTQGRISCIIEDQRGFMWFGTADGLNRYNGYSFKGYKKEDQNPYSIPGNSIKCIAEDKEGNLWIGTENGLAVLDICSERFTTFTESDSILDYHGANQIIAISIDQNNNVWCSTNGAGIFKFNPQVNERDYLTQFPEYKAPQSILVDRQNNLWIGDVIDNKIRCINLNNNTSKTYPLASNPRIRPFKSGVCMSLAQASNGRIWVNVTNISSAQGSLFYFDPFTLKFIDVAQHYNKEFIEEYSYFLFVIPSITTDNKGNIYAASMDGLIIKISENFEAEILFEENYSAGNSKLSVYKSKNDLLWIGLNGNGIQLSKPNQKGFALLNKDIYPDFSINSIRSIYEDDEYYWVSGYVAMIKINKKTKKITPIHANISIVYTIQEVLGSPNYLWLGTEGDGLKLFDKRNHKVLKTFHFEIDKTKDNHFNNIYCIHNISKDLSLLGTYGGLLSFNPKNWDFEFLPKSTKNNDKRYMTVSTITKDNAGNILIGYTQGEVGKFNIEKKQVESFTLLEEGPLKDNNNAVKYIFNDKQNNYWIATSNGLVYYQPSTGSKKVFTMNDGLPNNYIYSILQDNQENLWLSTNNGISCYKPKLNIFQNYDKSDGLQCNEFNTGAYFKAKDGTFFLGGIEGLNYFKPENVSTNKILPKIKINSIKIANKNISIGDVLKSNTLVIEPKENVFTIDFVGLSYINSDKNTYKYRIKNIDENWIDIGHRHYITFNRMKHGNYILEIMGSNNHGLSYKTPFSLNINIKPRFYETLWFKITLIAAAILLVFVFIKLRLKRSEAQKKKLMELVEVQTIDLKKANNNLKKEIKKHKETTKELKESNQTKDLFLSIIAHDILNPLGAITGLSELLSKNHNASEDNKQNWSTLINISANNLEELLQNLIYWSKLEQQNILPDIQELPLYDEIQKNTLLFNAALNQKGITISINADKNQKVLADENMLSAILRNIISNAVKFTPKKGNISISTIEDNSFIKILIKDSGEGMSDEHINKIMNTDNHLSSRGTDNECGNGIGLNLVIRFVKLCNGSIEIQSKKGDGSTITIKLPKAN